MSNEIVRYDLAIMRQDGTWETLHGTGAIAVGVAIGSLLEGNAIGPRTPIKIEVRIDRVLMCAVDHPDVRMKQRQGKNAPRSAYVPTGHTNFNSKRGKDVPVQEGLFP
jgi:hypothetical protein